MLKPRNRTKARLTIARWRHALKGAAIARSSRLPSNVVMI
jgi:hypothetical protein